MPFEVEREGTRVVLALEGPITIEQAAALRDSLGSSGVPRFPVLVQAERSGAVDLSIVQLLACVRACCPEFHIENPSDEFLSSLDRCAMRRIFYDDLKQHSVEDGRQPR